MTTEPLPLKGVPKAKVCKGCQRSDLKMPHPGPRCHRCHQAKKKADKANKAEVQAVRRYGMTKEFRDRLWAFQGRGCAVCGRKLGTTKAPTIEHDHAKPDGPPSWRGLCCARCNEFLGWIGDDPETADRLGRYLRDPPAQQLLREIARERTQQLIDDAWEVK